MIVKSIAHSYSNRNLLVDINFECQTGDVLGIFGRNGSGKSTLLKILFGTLKLQKGEIYTDNKIVSNTSGLADNVAYHHQEVFLPQSLTVRALVAIFFPDGENQSKVFYSPGINKIEKQKVSALSAGDQRYLQFLLLLHSNHHFLLLDEPFTMAGPHLKEIIKELIELHRSNKCFIITDHYYADVLGMASSKMFIKDGVNITIDNNKDLAGLGYFNAS